MQIDPLKLLVVFKMVMGKSNRQYACYLWLSLLYLCWGVTGCNQYTPPPLNNILYDIQPSLPPNAIVRENEQFSNGIAYEEYVVEVESHSIWLGSQPQYIAHIEIFRFNNSKKLSEITNLLYLVESREGIDPSTQWYSYNWGDMSMVTVIPQAESIIFNRCLYLVLWNYFPNEDIAHDDFMEYLQELDERLNNC